VSPSHLVTESPPERPTSSRGPKTWALRLVLVVCGLIAWRGTQALIGARPAAAVGVEAQVSGEVLTRGDGLLELTAPINKYLNENKRVAYGLLIVSSAMIDVLGVFLLGWSIFGQSLRPFIGLLVLFGLRQIVQVLCALPKPEGMIWEFPGVPSLLVTYDVGNDFFFSGHTALAVYGLIELTRFGGRRLCLPALVVAVFLIAVVIVLRAHYTMDVFAGVVSAICAAGASGWIMSFRAGACLSSPSEAGEAAP
jgi:membrane-associated phospholipid phosphatase